KSTLARSLRNHLLESGRRATLLDGDLVRQHLSAGLGFSPADRDTNIRRIGWVAAEIAYHGGVAICSPIAPYEHTRHAVRQLVEGRGGRFVLVHVATPLSECERRDRKGLYARARRGEIPDFTGVTAPYQEPADPDLRIDTTAGDCPRRKPALMLADLLTADSLGILTVSALVGVVIGLTGMGGGALMTPGLIFLGVPPTAAVANDLVAAVLNKSVGAAVHWRRGSPDLRLTVWLIVGSV